jgi:glucosamine-phosphate N-acetyltransferase
MPIRRLTANDYNRFFPLINEFRETSFSEKEFKYTLLDMNSFTHQIWVLEENNEFIGAGTIIFEKKFIYNLSTLGHIEDIIVKESYRGKGYGKQLVKHLLQIAKEYSSCYKVTLDCNDSNVGFYESCGLEKRGNQMCILTENL